MCATPGPAGHHPAMEAIRSHYHPLEIIPFFRRIPCSFGRDFAYTFIWNGIFAAGFYAINAAAAGKLPSLAAFQLIFVVSQIIGYTIHFLFMLGRSLGIDDAVRRSGGVVRATYYAGVPIVGVGIAFSLASLLFEGRPAAWLTDPAFVLEILVISLIVSMILTVIFVWRERDARAEMALAHERERAERREREAVLANLRALQAQIEPHFLFNTLANVASLIEAEPVTARRMLESFIRFLRASLAATRTQSTTLAAEAELIAAYLDVLQVRMGSRLRYAIDVPAELSAFAMPPMLLQPVVENAIVHGLEPSIGGGEVSFRARRGADGVVIEIADTGAGFAATTRGGTGLTNLRDRLRALYGERASLAIGERPGGGALVTIRIPDES